MAKPGRKGITRLIYAIGYSAKGMRSAWVHEAAFRQELILVLVLFPLAFWLGDAPEDVMLLIGSGILVLIVELLNSAVEAVVDQVTEEYAELAGRAKDMGSAAVMLSLCLMVLTWVTIGMDWV